MTTKIIFNHLNLTPLAREASTLTPGEIKAFLIEKGVLPSFDDAKASYWSLGAQWWKQIIDGKYHRYGPMVFDEGLHGKHVEPGYLKGIEMASHFFVDHFEKEFSLDLYKETHHIACAHFKPEKDRDNGMICASSEIDLFRTAGEECRGNKIESDEYKQVETKREVIRKLCSQLNLAVNALQETNEKDNELYEDPRFLAMLKRKGIQLPEGKKTSEMKQKDLEEAIIKTKEALGEQWVQPCNENESTELLKLLNAEDEKLCVQMKEIIHDIDEAMQRKFSSIAERLGLEKPFVECGISSDLTMVIYYLKSDKSLNYEEITQKLIAEFNFNLQSLQETAYHKIQSAGSECPDKEFIEDVKKEYQEAVTPLIAQLYAELEWAHPWIDGQGRTDLIVLNGLLSREGIHPCILNEPYYSTGNGGDLWVNYLKGGIAEFNAHRGV